MTLYDRKLWLAHRSTALPLEIVPDSAADASLPQFSYTPLENSEQQIRLLLLSPGNWNDEINCTLKTSNFDPVPAYEALSYVWGDPHVTKEIRVDKQIFKVTHNLWLALRRLRRRHIRTLWVDAVCINQQDIEEKSKQVALMGSIFERCQQGILWLGEDTDVDVTDLPSDLPPESTSAARAFELLRLFRYDKHWPELACFTLDESGRLSVKSEYLASFAALAVMFRLTWWTRIWVIQEALLPKRATFAYGSQELDFDILAQAILPMNHHGYRCCRHHRFEVRESAGWTSPRGFFPFGKFLKIFASMRKDLPDFRRLSLYAVRTQCSMMHATVSHDLIYALVGLTNDWGSLGPLIPDYSVPSKYVFAQAGLRIIDQQKSLDALRGLRHQNRSTDMPTWTPDWMISDCGIDYLANLDFRVRGISRTSGPSLSSWQAPVLVDRTMLRVQVTKLGSIKTLGRTLRSKGSLHKVLMAWMTLVRLKDLPTQLPTEANAPVDMFWRTVVHDASWPTYNDGAWRRVIPDNYVWRQVVPDDYQAFYDACKACQKYKAMDIESRSRMEFENPMLKRVWDSAHYRKMFLAHSGQLGMAPHGSREDDEIFVLHGANVPFILRKHGEQPVRFGEELLPTYTVLDECYLHGAMHGEGLEAGWEERSQTIALV